MADHHPQDDFGYDPPEPHGRYEASRASAKGCIVWVMIALAILVGLLFWSCTLSSRHESGIRTVPRFVPAVIHKAEN